MTAAPTPSSTKFYIGGKYHWRGQPEPLVYMGLCEPRNGRWHQFAKVDVPSVVWCEVTQKDLESFEPVIDAIEAQAPTPKEIA